MRSSFCALLFVSSAIAFAQGEPPAVDAPAPWEVKPELPHAERRAERPVAAQNLISINPLLWVNQEYAIEYERVISREVSLYVEPTFDRFGVNIDGSGTYWTRAFGGTVGVRVYPYSRAPTGFYVAPSFTLLLGHSMAAYTDGTGTRVDGYLAALGANAGYTFVFLQHLQLSLGLGLALTKSTISLDPYSVGGWGYSFTPRGGIGFAF